MKSRPRSNWRDLVADYVPLPGAPDEMLAANGALRPAWRSFIDYFSSLSDAEIAASFAQGDDYLRDAGVYYRHYSKAGTAERAWPLSHVPVILDESEWAEISAGLIQRAELLETIAADIYGPNRFVAEGLLPAELVAGNPEWLRPMVGATPAGGAFLNFIAFDIGRGPNGQWWVLDDRLQAPSGSGFTLENRIATATVYPEFYADANVHRIAGFFRSFRDSLAELRSGSDHSAAILSPGTMTDTYYEHAYIARYLGLALLEGEDLRVVNDRVMMRSVSGDYPVGVLWRRIDASFADPLELDGTSFLGTPGLVAAARNGNVAMVNALGVGALEAKALLAFLPGLQMALHGESLSIPSVATWWCGQATERAYVIENWDRMNILPAVSKLRLANGTTREGFGLDAPEFLTERNGRHFVGQELVTLSTTPVWSEGRLTPRPMNLRAYLARTSEGWVVMPGGFARIGRSSDATAVAMQQGGSVADVWIVSEKRVSTDTMAPPSGPAYVRPRSGALPTRAADNLFWLGRYVERAEASMRLLRGYFSRVAEAGDIETPLIATVRTHLEDLGIETDEAVPQALLNVLGAALGSASKVRDRLSLDSWMALNDLADSARRIAKTSVLGADSARAMGVLLRKITGFSGLVHENMYRSLGWRFLTLGRSMERALDITSLMIEMTHDDAPDGALDFAVEVADSTLSHRRRYTLRTTRPTVVDLLGLDEFNPRSIASQLHEIKHQIELLPGSSLHGHGHISDLMRGVLKAETSIAAQTAEGLTTEVLSDTYRDIEALSDLLSAAYLT